MSRQSAKSLPAILRRSRPTREKCLQGNPHLSKDTHVVENCLHQEDNHVCDSNDEKLLPPLKDDNMAETFVSEGETSNFVQNAEESKILLLASDVQKLENFLNFEMEKMCTNLAIDPSCSGYYHLSVLTAAKIILFNKPRANRAMQLTVAAFNDKSAKLDTLDETVQCLSSVEKKLCDRLDVVKTFDKGGKMMPILLTPSTKKSMDLLLAKRSQVNIQPDNPYIFSMLVDRMISSMGVLHIVTENVQLDNPGLLQDARLQRHVAFISQIMAMQGSELEWLASHIAYSLACKNSCSPQISAQEMSQVVQLCYGIDCRPAHHNTDQALSQLQSSEVVSSTQDSCLLDEKPIPPEGLLEENNPARKLVVKLSNISKYLVRTGQDLENITEGVSVGIEHIPDGVQKVFAGDKSSVGRSTRKCREKEHARDVSSVQGSTHIQKKHGQKKSSLKRSSTCTSPLACIVSRVPMKEKMSVCKTPNTLPAGLLLTDGKDSWLLGSSTGRSGFGELYRATFRRKEESSLSMEEFDAHLIKIELKHRNALFHQLERYQTATEPGNIDKWKQDHRLRHLAIPKHVALGQYEHNKAIYNFVVLEKVGKDLHYKLRMRNHQLEPTLAYSIAIQLVEALEYIHSYGFVNADIRPANIVIRQGPLREGFSKVILVDFGIAPSCMYTMQEASEGALEYTSRDVHSGVAPSKRGDIETLAYNLIHWLSGTLPWEGVMDKDEVSRLKTVNMRRIHCFLSHCFGERIYASQLYLLLKYVSKLGYEETPDYSHVKRLLKKANRYHKKLIVKAVCERELLEERSKKKKEKQKRSQKDKKRKASNLESLPKGVFPSSKASNVPANPPSQKKSNQAGKTLIRPASTSLPSHPEPSNRIFILPPNSDQPGLVILTRPVSTTTLPAHPGPSNGIVAYHPLKRKSNSNGSHCVSLRKRIRPREDSKASFSPMPKAAEPAPRQKIVLLQQNEKIVQHPVTYAIVVPQVPPSEQPKVNSIHLGLPDVGGQWGVNEGYGNRTIDGILSNKDKTNGSTDGILSNNSMASEPTDGILNNVNVASWSADGILRDSTSGSTDGILKDSTSGSTDGILGNKDRTNLAVGGSLNNNRNTSGDIKRENLAHIGDLNCQIKTEPDDMEYRQKEMNSDRDIEQETWTVMVEDAVSCDDIKPDPDVENGEVLSRQGVDQGEKTDERGTSSDTGGVSCDVLCDDVKPDAESKNDERCTSAETDQEAIEAISANQNVDAYTSSENRAACSNDPRGWKKNAGQKDPSRPGSGHVCMFCGVLLSEMVDHLITTHKNEKQVQEALSSQQAMEQRAAIDELKLYGDHCHNIQVLQRRTGTLIVLKEDQCNQKRQISPCGEDYLPCPECMGYTFYGDFLCHRMRCDAFFTRMRSFCEKSHVKERKSQALKNKAVLTFVNTGISGARAIRNIFILMLSDALKLEKDFEKIKFYNVSMMKAVCLETVSFITCNASEMWHLLENVRQGDTRHSPVFPPEKVDALFRLIKWLYDQSLLKDHLHLREYEIGYLATVIRNVLVSCAIKLKHKASAARDCDILSRNDQFISMFRCMARNDKTNMAAIPKHILNIHGINNTSEEKKRLNRTMNFKADLSEIQSLVSYVQELENYLNTELDKNFEQLKKRRDRTSYLGLSLATAAKIVLLNKPRATEAMQLREQSYNEESLRYDPEDSISRGLTTIEKILLERLHVMKISDKDGQMVPILLTPKIQKAVELLMKRRVANIHPNNPYIFAKWDYLMDSMKASSVLSTIAISVHCDSDYLQDARLQKHVAAISQIMAMEDNELDWLKYHIANSSAGTIDVRNVQSSPLEIAKVVQLFCTNDIEETEVSTVHRDDSLYVHDAQQLTSNQHEQSGHTNRSCTVPTGRNYELVPDGSSGQVSFERNCSGPDFGNCQAPDVNNCPGHDSSSNGELSFVRNYLAPDTSNFQKPDVRNSPEPVHRNHQVPDDNSFQVPVADNCQVHNASNCQVPDGNSSQVPVANNCQVPDASNCQIPDGSNGQVSFVRNYPAPDFSNFQMPDINNCLEPLNRNYHVHSGSSSQVPESRLTAQSHSPQYKVENQCHYTKESVTNLLEPDSVSTDLSSIADNVQKQEEEEASEINISVNITNVMEASVEEPIEEKYSDVLRRTGLLTSDIQDVSDIRTCVGEKEVKKEEDAS